MTLKREMFTCYACAGDGYISSASYSPSGLVSNGLERICPVCRGNKRIKGYLCPTCGERLSFMSKFAPTWAVKKERPWLQCPKCGFTNLLCPHCLKPLELSDSYSGTTIRGGDVVDIGEECWVCPQCGYEER
jgi:uncharacterized protein with PIN domain